jgi:hypothetical protein
MTSRQHESEGLIGKAVKLGVKGVVMASTGSTLAHGLDGAFPNDAGVDVTGMNGSQIDSGSVLHHGPSEGGELLDRPSAGYLAHASTDSGVALTHDMDVSTIARDINDAGTFSTGSGSVSVMDYLPGGDMVQLAAGQVDPSQIAMGMLQQGMERQMADGGATGTTATGGVAMDPSGIQDVTTSEPGARTTEGIVPQEGMSGGTAAATGGTAAATGGGTAAAIAAARSFGGHVPDADENARDMEALAFQHRLDLDTAVETSDSAHVHTEIHAHGRTLEIDTDFEATAHDNAEERAEAAEHVREATHSPLSEMEHSRPDMHFRSKVHAFLDAASRDEGIGL